ncbi:polyhydroxyalkanoic acid synthase subunit PhaR [Priestia megaterium]|nr:polyhydroxyalkanoic acid synthase subunit PhaR [Priestia megaterium]
MEQKKVLDPFQAWKDVYDKTESYWGKVIGDNMNREEFSQIMGNVLNMNLQYQQAVNEVTNRYFQQVNIPTKEDVANVASLVINVEEKVEALEDRFDDLEDKQENGAVLKREVTKLKSDVKSLDKKLDQVLSLLESQQETQSLLQDMIQEQIQEQSEQLKTQILEKQQELFSEQSGKNVQKSEQPAQK